MAAGLTVAAKQITREGRKVWVVHRTFRNDKGKQERYRRDASVQTRAGAEADDRELQAYFRDHRTIEGFREETNEAQCLLVGQDKAKEKTWADAAQRYRDVKLPTLRYETRKLYGKILESPYLAAWQDIPLPAFSKAILERLDTLLIKSGVGGSRQRHFAAVYRGALRGAKVEGWIVAVPEFPPLAKVHKKLMPHPHQEDIDALLNELDKGCSKYHTACRRAARLAFAISAYGGLRSGEVRGLRWADISLRPLSTAGETKGLITVRRSRGSDGVEGPPKSGADRNIPIAPVLLPFLAKAQVEARLRHPDKQIDDEFVSVNGSGHPWGDTALRSALQRACKRLNLPKARYHSLRHFFITALFESGSVAPTVQKLAGHHHLSVTQGYAHVSEEMMAAAVGRLGRGNSVAMKAAEAPDAA